MSVVTDLILSFSCGENSVSVLNKLESFIVNGNPFKIVSVEDESLPKYWYGGGKVLRSNLFIGAYNHLDLNELIKFLRNAITWEDPEDVQLIVKEEHEFRFKIIDIFN